MSATKANPVHVGIGMKSNGSMRILKMPLRGNLRGLSFFGDLFFKRQNISKIFRNVFNWSSLTCTVNFSSSGGQHALPKKRLTKKKKLYADLEGFRIAAYSTAEEYNLELLAQELAKMTSFRPTTFGSEYGNLIDVIHATQNSESESESQDLFFFRNGSIVMWNISELEVANILNIIKHFEDGSFKNEIVKGESEILTYSYCSEINKTKLIKENVRFSDKSDTQLEKYAVSNAIALSVHLGTYEASLEQYIETMESVTEDLKSGEKIKMSRDEVLQKTGQLFALRHNINLSSDLLDTPDFYWDQAELEILYQSIFNYFCISKRTRVINEKINHCIELVELLSSHLNDKHHVRLEWMIIVLIMVEVAFEVLHYLERYLESKESNHHRLEIA